MIDDVICIIFVQRLAILVCHSWQPEASSDIKQHTLEAAHIPVWLKDWPADGIGNGISLTNRSVQKTDTVMAFKIGCIRQDEVSKSHHLRRIGI